MNLDTDIEISFDPDAPRPRRKPAAQPELPLDLPPPKPRQPWRVRDICEEFEMKEGVIAMAIGRQADGTPDWLIECTAAFIRFLACHPVWVRQLLDTLENA